VTEAPSDRWDPEDCARLDPGFAARGQAIRGGFLRDIDQFDPAFFGISPREAVTMDPQQRLVLEVSWEALEQAGIAPDGLAGSLTGVFVGITVFDYVQRLNRSDRSRLEMYVSTGNAHSATPGRVSYVLGLQGPSVAVDTACSSSLTAVHLACQSLRLRESDLALAGGVNALFLPDSFLSFTRGGLISPDGRCKAFDASADGLVRSEGCGIVVLKRLSDALASGDRVLALIVGSALNQDGASGGLTVPNGLAQQAVIRQALRVAGVAPAQVGYVEGHGTGTALGDPLELEALDAVLGEGRSADRPLVVGSVKTNLGHTEAAAGMAGLIKVVLALQNEEIPPHLHYRRLNPNASLRNAAMVVPTARRPWPSGQGPRIAGVSSFGFSGTNAHVLVAEAPVQAAPARAPERPVHLLVLSAKSEGARAQLALRYARHFERHPELDFGDVCFTAAVGRARLPFRLALVGASLQEARDKLAGAADARPRSGALQGRVGGDCPPVAFLFTGQGAQYAGMGRQLYENEPVFRKTLDRCHELLRSELTPSLLSVLYDDAGASLINQTAYAQPALFALEYALAELWRSWGVEPAVVMGHSVGEYVAACVAGVFSLEEGLAFVAARGRLMQALPPGGEMAAVVASEERVAAAVARHPRAAAIAAVNGPAGFVVSGSAEALGAIVAEVVREGTAARRLDVSHAFHSPLMDPVLDELERLAAGMSLSPPRIPLVSNLTGRLATHEVARPLYWRRHAREPVRFSRGVETLREEGCSLFLEVGPHSTLVSMGRSCLPDGFGTWLPSLRRDRDPWRELLTSLATLYVNGVEVDGRALDRDRTRRRVALPTYPFERSRYWADDAWRSRVPADGVDACLYEVAWEPRPAVSARSPRSGRWLVLADARGVGSELVKRLSDGGAACTVVLPGGDYAVEAGGVVRVDPARPEHMHRLWREAVAAADPTPVRVVHLWSLDAPAPVALRDLGTARGTVCGSALNLVQAVLAREGAAPARIHLVTCGAEAVRPGEVPALVQAPLWGLGRGIAVEHPEIWGGLVDLDPAAPAARIETLLAELDAPSGEDQVALRGGARHVARLARKMLPAERPRPASLEGTYLVTGGLGGLGLRVARWLVARGARHLALVGRRPPSAAQAETVGALAAEGASVQTFAADVADPARMAAVFAEIQAGWPPLRGVVHAAGVITLQAVDGLSEDAVAEVFRPKVTGAWVLHELTRELALDFFVSFSSAASVWGSRLLAHYAAANHFLDALALHRRDLGLPALSVSWGPWAEGMTSSDGRRALAEMGVGALSVPDGLKALDRLLAAGVDQATVAAVDWDVFAPVYSAKVRRPLLERLESGAPTPEARPDAGDLARELADALPADRWSLLSLHVQAEASRVLGGKGSAPLEPGQGFKELGMDSLMAVELRNRLQHRLGRPLPSTLAFDYPTIEGLVAHLLQQVPGLSDVAVPPRSREADELAALETLSEDEVKELIAEELQSLSPRTRMESAR
jgi:acyl transferase domain-containing protein